MGKALFEVSKQKIENSKQQETSDQNLKDAISYLKQSISLAEKRKMKLDLAESLYELAKVMLETGNNTVVLCLKEIRMFEVKSSHHNVSPLDLFSLQKLKEAEKIFKKAGAERWVEKVDKLTKKR